MENFGYCSDYEKKIRIDPTNSLQHDFLAESWIGNSLLIFYSFPRYIFRLLIANHNLTLSVTVVTVLDYHPKFQF